jgi:hypothetical protein
VQHVILARGEGVLLAGQTLKLADYNITASAVADIRPLSDDDPFGEWEFEKPNSASVAR